jgi:hypothetical protein
MMVKEDGRVQLAVQLAAQLQGKAADRQRKSPENLSGLTGAGA